MALSQNDEIPSRKELYNPTIAAIRSLGGSGHIEEIREQVIQDLKISEKASEATSKDGRRVELAYRLAWVRTVLKSHGIIDNPERGVWSLTGKGRSSGVLDPDKISSTYRPIKVSSQHSDEIASANQDAIVEVDQDPDPEIWKTQLMGELLNLPPDAFERLCQRILRASGFTKVTVTKYSNDGGIDGHGLIRMSGLISFPVVFQCKRYTGNVTAGNVRDFRGAMQGRAEKGLVVTTGGFTQDARKEAARDGVPLIDLIDGELLLELLKDLRLGVRVTQTTVEDIEVHPGFFETI